ncbi:hypothetical protein T4A_838 [Trichinella pseudospiralis]|uniref:Uncharacterized protein n=1 Tax=Trichinella pseudospiralis TaxID=6337 RepID=A0A0V1DKS5_TRIPS|nr:hypothetical protein T4A_838 [Trichinella pseudospiralis]
MNLEIPDSHEINQNDVAQTNNIKKKTNIGDLIELHVDPEQKNEPRNSRLS